MSFLERGFYFQKLNETNLKKHDAEDHVCGGNPEKPRRFGSLVKLQIIIT